MRAPLSQRERGADKALRAVITGIPNVGKSSLINTLLGRPVAAVSDKPAVTKETQLVTLPSGMQLTDNPRGIPSTPGASGDTPFRKGISAMTTPSTRRRTLATLCLGVAAAFTPRGEALSPEVRGDRGHPTAGGPAATSPPAAAAPSPPWRAPASAASGGASASVSPSPPRRPAAWCSSPKGPSSLRPIP
ncbi:MAG: 50S ribosome-binding GTPase [Deltaproteobacteria bacterium]|nr:50S ribosome-binding GTPase [Deltaproteobacteria bacterium]